MQKKKSSQASLGDVAKAAGVSRATACYALRNHAGPSQATKERVLRIAAQLGYAPDARINTYMAKVRDAKARDLLPIAWLNTHEEKDAWQKNKYLSPYLEGAAERSSQLGYRLEEIWLRQPGMTMRRVSKILDQRGVEGIIVTHFVRHFRLNWNYLVGVSLDGMVLAPHLHSVTSDTFSNFLVAIKMLKRFGYQRIGICLDESIDRRTHQGISAMTHFPEVMFPKSKRVPPYFYTSVVPTRKKEFSAWVRRHRPDVIVGHNNLLVQWVEEAGYRVPEDIGVIHLATDDDVSDWAGIHSKRREIGAYAAEWVISQIQNRQFGIPKTAVNMTIQGAWHNGRTLLAPKPA